MDFQKFSGFFQVVGLSAFGDDKWGEQLWLYQKKLCYFKSKTTLYHKMNMLSTQNDIHKFH